MKIPFNVLLAVTTSLSVGLMFSVGLILNAYLGSLPGQLETTLYYIQFGLYNAVSKWFYFRPWSQASINSYPSEIARDTYRVLVVVVFLAGSGMTYLCFTSVKRLHAQFDWRMISTLVVLGWLALDAPWHYQLWKNLISTQTAFAGKSEAEKALAGPDKDIYQLIEDVRSELGDVSERVFIASPDEYLGLRAAYRLYPHNPFWRRHFTNELPVAADLRPGDFILAVRSHKVLFDRETGQLGWPPRQQVHAAQVLVKPLGSLYQVLKP